MRFRDRRMLQPKADSHIRFGVAKRCCWCGISVAYKGKRNQPYQATREHIVPRSKGGGGARNIAVACRRCNTSRGTDSRWVFWRDIPQWLRKVGTPMRRVGDELEPCFKTLEAPK